MVDKNPKPKENKEKTHVELYELDLYELLRRVVEGEIEDIKPKTDPFKEREFEIWVRDKDIDGHEIHGYYEVKITEDGKVKILYEQWS
jgi:hypothetical protein